MRTRYIIFHRATDSELKQANDIRLKNMIDLKTEPLIPLAEARHHDLLKTRAGRSPEFCTMFRYAYHGVRGVKLETVSKPYGLATSEAAIQRFIENLTAAS